MGLDVSGITVQAGVSNSTCNGMYRASVVERMMKRTDLYGAQHSWRQFSLRGIIHQSVI